MTVLKSGTGTVTSNVGGINCGTTCTATVTAGTNVTLTASPAAGWIFSGWTAGPCAGSSPTCTVTMNSAQSVTAVFARAIGSLSITLGGLPAGTVVVLGITGPDGFNITRSMLTGTGSNLSDVVTGTYTVTAPATTIGLTSYSAPAQSAVVNFGTTATINVVYSSTPVVVNGVCGSANAVAAAVAPTLNLCSSGAASAVTGAGPWNWTCNGSNGGTSGTCSAPKSTLAPKSIAPLLMLLMD